MHTCNTHVIGALLFTWWYKRCEYVGYVNCICIVLVYDVAEPAFFCVECLWNSLSVHTKTLPQTEDICFISIFRLDKSNNNNAP